MFRHCVSLLTLFALTLSVDAKEIKPLKVAITVTTGKKDLEKFKEYVEANYHIEFEFVEAPKGKKKGAGSTVENIQALAHCDVILSNFYRTWAKDEHLTLLKKAFLSKPVVGLRKAHHGFQNWLKADQEVFGMSYKGHYFPKKGKKIKMYIMAAQRNNPLLKDLELIEPAGGLYRHIEAKSDVVPLIMGGPEDKEMVPQSWLRESKETGQRVLYSRYDPKDLSNVSIRDMVIRALCWTAKRQQNQLKK